ncbi:MAG: heme biosynthesis HemY N-terminal domain-containing protein [Alphaproteobacteria bacterium]|nr:heme biosynthesis HemY N-terminal domain-containing protein [Alphaproteobacteria bacterium]
MIRFLRFLVQLALLLGVALWLADRPGEAHIVWHDTVIETSAAFLAVAVLVLGLVIHLLFRLWYLLRDGPALWRMRRDLAKAKRGQDLIAQGLVALAAGNASEAGRLAVAARKNMGRTISTQWLQAQAAQLAGDRRAAKEIFRALAANDAAAVLGYRGLVAEAKRDGNWEEIDALLSELHRQKPSTPWLSLMRMESAARHCQWENAEQALSHAIAAKLMDSDQGRQTRAALRVAVSRAAAMAADKSKALQAAEQAVKLAPDWLPALLRLADALAATGHARAATRMIEHAWKTQPHPQLAHLLRRMAKTPLEAFKQTEKLCQINPSARESRLAMAEAALDADIWGEARRHLTACINERCATQGVYRLLARLERGEHHDERAAAQWLSKAAEAAPDPAWLCRTCGQAHEVWIPLCSPCGSFNSLEWRRDGKSRPSLPHKKGLLDDDES